ncbi:MAG: hypothetical protein IPO44_07565 [Candidatus Microthrix sp.]|nr:hypothetical protein [Candidatus Microthrix sp.]MBK9559403.1 hypothetical protein [Candidatus Microthrix sp.]
MNSPSTQERTSAVVGRTDELSARWAPAVLRWTAALLWLSNLSWKVPTAFGQAAGSAAASAPTSTRERSFGCSPAAHGSSSTYRAPNLSVFGWMTLFVEATLVALLLSGRYLRLAAVLGFVQAFGIGLSVANADGEWYWSYLLMMALHVAILALAPQTRPVRAAPPSAGCSPGTEPWWRSATSVPRCRRQQRHLVGALCRERIRCLATLPGTCSQDRSCLA